MTDLRDKIARALFLFDYEHQGADAWEASRLDGNSDRPHAYSQADAVLAVLDLGEIRAEAQVEALREVAQDAEWSDVALPGMTAKDVIRGVRARADRIAREAGIETGEGDER